MLLTGSNSDQTEASENLNRGHLRGTRLDHEIYELIEYQVASVTGGTVTDLQHAILYIKGFSSTLAGCLCHFLLRYPSPFSTLFDNEEPRELGKERTAWASSINSRNGGVRIHRHNGTFGEKA